MNIRILLPTIVLASCVIAGCQATANPNEQSGVLVGAALGGVLGHQVGDGFGRTAATIIGSVVGSEIGGSIGRTMDDVDRMKVSHSLETIRTGVPTTWRNPDTSNRYTVVPTRTYEESGNPCREYTLDAIIGGQSEQIHGTACRQADGSWKTIS